MKRHDDMPCEGIEKRMEELARRYAETHDPKVKAEVEELSQRYALARQFFFLQLRADSFDVTRYANDEGGSIESGLEY